MRLLIIEDSLDLLASLTEALGEHYAVDGTSTGKEAIYFAGINSYDLIIMDIGLPDTDGITVCRTLREQGIKTPILMLTGRSALEDKVAALDIGADDYLTKPFQFPELLARLRALLRRPMQEESGTVLTFGNLQLDLVTRTVYRSGKKIDLRRKELDLLELLMRNQGKVVTRTVILEHVWSSDVNSFTNAIDVHIKHLRDQIDKPYNSHLVQTVYGAGYRLGSPKPLSRPVLLKAGSAQKGGGAHGKRYGTTTR